MAARAVRDNRSPLCMRRRAGMLLILVAAAGCGSDFTICTDPDGDPPDCELCANDRDDDLDGDVDCRDSDCDGAVACRDENLSATTTTDGGQASSTTPLQAGSGN